MITIIGFCLLVGGCSSSGRLKISMGTTIDKNRLSFLDNEGHHFQVTKYFNIEYEYSIDHNAKTITLDGAMKYNKTVDESANGSETVFLKVKYFQIIVVFTDKTGKVNGIESFFTDYYGQNIFTPTQFKKTLPFSDNYKYIFFGYSAYYEGD
jgi:hypothetical protein